MTPPREYFELVIGEHKEGDQRIGFEWYRFTDQNALARMIEDGGLAEIPLTESARNRELEKRIESLEAKIDRAIGELE